MTVNFVTPTRISLINLTTIGDSEKRDNPETDFEEFIVQYIDLKYKGNVITNMAKYIIKLIKR